MFAAIASQFTQELAQANTVRYDSGRPLDEQLREIARLEVEQVTSDDHIAVFRVYFAELTRSRLRACYTRNEPTRSKVQKAAILPIA